ncbi:MAG TPA: hypothetical protein VFR93_04610 [Candidatus Limnocylindrales bacterium]|jgi:hypothetical protein|nr:hypothetical protein [Candidatus Limnocylindrales bacterium]
MADTLERVLQLVAEGRLTAEEAAPILDALNAADDAIRTGTAAAELGTAVAGEPAGGGAAKAIRIEVSDKGRKVVNLRIPIPLGRFALDRIPGLAGNHADLVRQALADGRTGTLLVLDDDGDGVRIALE